MRLSLRSARPPIERLEAPELGNFTILSGLNGSGKTQLLLGLRHGEITADSITSADTAYFDRTTFRVPKTAFASYQAGYDDAFWQYLEQLNFSTWLSETFRTLFPGLALDTPLDRLPEGGFLRFADEVNERFLSRESNSRLSLTQVPETILNVLKRRGTLGTPMTKDEFLHWRREYLDKQLTFMPSLRRLYESYIERQSNWALNEFRTRSGQHNFEELKSEFGSLFPPPWAAINDAFEMVRGLSKDEKFFELAVRYPIQTARGPSIGVVHRETGQEIDLQNLSSGEQIILALVFTVFGWKDGAGFPKLLLLDEIDSALHPRASAVLVEMLRRLGDELGMKIIMTTHSPTTVAVAPTDGLIEQTRRGGNVTLRKVERATLIDTLCEGLLTVETIAESLNSAANSPITIFTEGKNRAHIVHALSLLGSPQIPVFPHMEAETSDGALGLLFKVFAHVPGHSPVLFVWDCDYIEKLPAEANNTFAFAFPLNPESSVSRGIENVYPAAISNLFARQVRKGEETKTIISNKRAFLAHILSLTDPTAFVGFETLIEKIKSISAK